MSTPEQHEWEVAYDRIAPNDRWDLETIVPHIEREVAEERAARQRRRRIAKRIIAISGASLAVVGAMSYLGHRAYQDKERDDRQDKAAAVSQVLQNPEDLLALGICPDELRQEAKLFPSQARQYRRAAIQEAAITTGCPEFAGKAASLEVPIGVANIRIVVADILPAN